MHNSTGSSQTSTLPGAAEMFMCFTETPAFVKNPASPKITYSLTVYVGQPNLAVIYERETDRNRSYEKTPGSPSGERMSFEL